MPLAAVPKQRANRDPNYAWFIGHKPADCVRAEVLMLRQLADGVVLIVGDAAAKRVLQEGHLLFQRESKADAVGTANIRNVSEPAEEQNAEHNLYNELNFLTRQKESWVSSGSGSLPPRCFALRIYAASNVDPADGRNFRTPLLLAFLRLGLRIEGLACYSSPDQFAFRSIVHVHIELAGVNCR